MRIIRIRLLHLMSLDQIPESLDISNCNQLVAIFADNVCDDGTVVAGADVLKKIETGGVEEVVAWHGRD